MLATAVHLTDEQRKRIFALAEAEDVTMASIIRRAVDAYLEGLDPEQVLASTVGASPDAAVPGRDEWDRG